WLSRNTDWDSWSGSNWNMVFVGANNAPPQHFPNPSHTVVDLTPVSREKPFLYLDDSGYRVYVPALAANTRGTTWANGQTLGSSLSLADFYIVQPGSPTSAINAALAQGKHLLFTPGVHHLSETIRVTNPDTVVLGLGMATLMPD